MMTGNNILKELVNQLSIIVVTDVPLLVELDSHRVLLERYITSKIYCVTGAERCAGVTVRVA